MSQDVLPEQPTDTQPVSGTVAVSNLPVTQPVSGTVTANAGTGPWPVTDNGGNLSVDDGGGSLTVDGTFWQATQPISMAAALPAGSNVIGHVIADTGSTTAVTGNVATTNAAASQADGHSATLGATADADTALTVIGRLKQIITTLQARLPAALVGGRLDVNVGAALPAGTNSIGTVQAVQASPTATTGTLTAAAATVSASVVGYAACSLSINGTYTNFSGIWEVSDDGGTTWYTTQVSRVGAITTVETSPTALTSTSRLWTANVAGLTNIRLRCTAIASGTVNVRITPEASAAVQGVVTVVGNVSVAQSTASSLNATVSQLDYTQLTGEMVSTVAANFKAQVQGAAASAAAKSGNPVQTGGVFNTTQPTVTNGQAVESQATARGAQIVATGVDALTVTPPALTKGTQGATGFSTQDLKDAGRALLVLSATNIAAGTSAAEAMFSCNQMKGTTATGSVTSYTPTSGKTLRLTGIQFAVTPAAATVANLTVTIRLNTAGAAVVGSSVVASFRVGSPAVNGQTTGLYVPFPDGIEFAGDGTLSIGISNNPIWTTTAARLDCCLTGFEY